MTQPRDFPYIYTTWIASLLSGDRSCEWATWFRAHYQGYAKVARPFDSARWNQEHTELLNRKRGDLERLGHKVYTEGQNKFDMRGATAILSGKADLVGIADDFPATVYDAKTGRAKTSDIVQVQIYMYALPRAIGRYKGLQFDGCLVYSDHEETIPASTITAAFINRLGEAIQRVASSDPAVIIPAFAECRYCDITSEDCAERVEKPEQAGETTDF